MPTTEIRTGVRHSFRLDIGFADDAAILIKLFAKKSGEVDCAGAHREETLSDKLRLKLGDPHRCSEPAGKLACCFLWRLRWCEKSPPEVHLVITVGFGDCRQIRQ